MFGEFKKRYIQYFSIASIMVSSIAILQYIGFNPFNMEYKLEVSSPTLSVYATLTSTDSSYVKGYEPRTVNLSYGVNTILIKIQNKEGKIRTYTILATRTDDNKEMKFNKMPGINKGLNPDFFTGNNTKIVNAINKLASEVNALETAVVDMINKTNSVLMDVNSIENQEVWEETKRLMGEDTIIEGIRALLDGKMQDKILNIDEEDEG